MAAVFFWRRESAMSCRARTFFGEPDSNLQRFDFVLCQWPQLTQRQVPQLDRTDPDADQFFDKVIERFEHSAHFPLAPFLDLDLDPSVGLKLFNDAGARRRGHAIF